jgi:glutathione S-transferase
MLNLASMRSWYEAALLEPWRDLPHEEEIAQYGQVIQDLRAPHGAPQAP